MARPFYEGSDSSLLFDEDPGFLPDPRRRGHRDWDFPPHFYNLSSLSTTPDCHCRSLELCSLRHEVESLRMMMYERTEYMYKLERLFRRAMEANEPRRTRQSSVESRITDRHFVPSHNSTCVFPTQPRMSQSPGDFSFSNRENEDTTLYSFGEIDENVEVGETGHCQKDSFVLDDFSDIKPFGDHEVLMIPFLYEPEKTGFEKTSRYPIIIGEVIADRYQIEVIIATTRTSTVLECFDKSEHRQVCVKVIDNTKEAFDQGLDEVKLNKRIEPLKSDRLAHMTEFFYYKEHLFIVFELLGENLYMLSLQPTHRDLIKANAKTIVRQLLQGLKQVHSVGVIHADIKPENILATRKLRQVGEQRVEVKLVDFGSSCFKADEPSFYLQSLSYRAPEVILGGHYDYKIDVWGVGCVLAEIVTGEVLFSGSTQVEVLHRIEGVLQARPTEGKHLSQYYTEGKLIDADELPQVSHLEAIIEDRDLREFLRALLAVNPKERPTAGEALELIWLQS